jgi:hypothetical protein
MAKAENVNFIEQHVEKIILGLCGVLVIAAVWHWVIASPVELDVINTSGRGTAKAVAPEQVDQMLHEAAENVRAMYDRAKSDIEPLPKWAGRTNELVAIAPRPDRPLDLGLPGSPMEVGSGVKIEQREVPSPAVLADLIPVLPKPQVTIYQELPQQDTLKDRVVARAAMIFPFNKLLAAWQEKLKSTQIPTKVIVQEVVVEVQQARPDGGWGPGKTAVLSVPPDKDGKPLAAPRVPKYDGTNAEEVRTVRTVLAGKVWQDFLLRPQYYRIWVPAEGGWISWRVHAPKLNLEPGQAPIWFHDDNTMQLGGVYRYRIQLVLLNPMVTYEQAVGKDYVDYARQTFIRSKFSPWSDAVSRKRQLDFFLTGASETTRQMTVTVYAYKWGQWVKHSFRVGRGQAIGGDVNVDVADPLGQPGAKRRIPVGLSTGAVALWFNFHKRVIRGGFASRTAEMVYLTPKAILASRVRTRDDASDLRATYEREIQAAGRGK